MTFIFAVTGDNSRILYIVSEHSITELYAQFIDYLNRSKANKEHNIFMD